MIAFIYIGPTIDIDKLYVELNEYILENGLEFGVFDSIQLSTFLFYYPDDYRLKNKRYVKLVHPLPTRKEILDIAENLRIPSHDSNVNLVALVKSMVDYTIRS